ncbi:HU family DNA-binding protein [Dysgonomonas sp. 520]|uniref:HU family DNA-binding protein n=1 Tax=Dysgonomonas sp. 520 TaxID=2302931 RepID=UPI0013D0E9DC|nr:HU family DNA-binding protein [Dysgonomonas sp. 520]NDW10977.1 integration host factor subunit beta [Dysgonomonas sp. 520]
MTKADLISEISKNTGVSRASVSNVLESFMETVKKSLANDEDVHLRGFGNFVVKHKAEKKARNINTNTQVIVPAHRAPAFKVSKEFRIG